MTRLRSVLMPLPLYPRVMTRGAWARAGELHPDRRTAIHNAANRIAICTSPCGCATPLFAVKAADIAALLDLVEQARVDIVPGLRAARFRRADRVERGLNPLWLRRRSFPQALEHPVVDPVCGLRVGDAVLFSHGLLRRLGSG